MAEVAVGTLIIALLLVTAVVTLRVTERGTVNQKLRQQAMDLAKGKSEELKSYLTSQNWNNIQVDMRFPPTQTPAVNSYNSYAATTVTLGKNTFILDPEVRYVYANSSQLLQYLPTPGTAATPEVGNMVRIRMDCYYGPLAEFMPLPTAEAVSNTSNRVVYTNILSNRTIYVGATSSLQGYVYLNCNPAQPVTTQPEVALFQGAQKVQSAIADQNGFYQMSNIQQGIYVLKTGSSPGYAPVSNFACNFTEPQTIVAGVNPLPLFHNLGLNAIPVVYYYGVVVKTTPVVTTVPPTSPTPTPNPTAVAGATPIVGAIVFADDGNSSPTTSVANGAYTIAQVQATPNAGHPFDTIEGDYLNGTPVPAMGKNYNGWPSIYGPPGVSFGQTYIGPVTVYLQGPIANTQPVTFSILDGDTNAVLGNGYYAVTLNVADGSASPPSTIISSNAINPVALNVHQGAPNVSVNLSNNTNPAPSYITFNQSINIGASVSAPLTLLNYAVGSAAGTVAGMGASFDYTQFTVHAVDASSGQYVYDVPVSYDGASTFGTFNYQNFRTPAVASYDLVYTFSANSNGNFTSNQVQEDVRQGQLHKTPLILVSLLNVYMAVTVTYQNGTPYPYGSWVSAIMVPNGQTPQSLPVSGMGSGYGVSNYFSTITKGDGTAQVQVQLSAGAPTSYVVYAQIVDPNSYAVSQKSTTVIVNTTANPSSPAAVSIGF